LKFERSNTKNDIMGLHGSTISAILCFLSYQSYIFNLGMMASGAINVVRGSRSSDAELLQIYNHSERFVSS